MNYTVISEQRIDDLIAKVKQHIARGWKPLGGVSASHSMGNWTLYAQAMIQE